MNPSTRKLALLAAAASVVSSIVSLRRATMRGASSRRSVADPQAPEAAPFNSPSAAFGAFAQGHHLPEVFTLHRNWARLSTCCSGEMKGGPLEGYFVADTRLVSKYGLKLNGAPVFDRGFSVQVSAHAWAGTFPTLVPEPQDDLPEGQVPDGTVETSIQRGLAGEGWTEQIRIVNHSQREKSVELEIELACPIDDAAYDEEMKQAKGATEGVEPSVERVDGRTTLRFTRDFGARRRAPTAELERVFGNASPRDGDRVVRSVELHIESQGEVEVRAGALTRILVRQHLPARGVGGLKVDFSGDRREDLRECLGIDLIAAHRSLADRS